MKLKIFLMMFLLCYFLAADEKCKITVSVDTSFAPSKEVELDSLTIDEVPFDRTVSVAPGNYTIQIFKIGYKHILEFVKVEKGQKELFIKRTLYPRERQIYFDIRDAESKSSIFPVTVTLDNGQSVKHLDYIEPNAYEFTVEKRGYKTFVKVFDIGIGKAPFVLKVRMQKDAMSKGNPSTSLQEEFDAGQVMINLGNGRKNPMIRKRTMWYLGSLREDARKMIPEFMEVFKTENLNLQWGALRALVLIKEQAPEAWESLQKLIQMPNVSVEVKKMLLESLFYERRSSSEADKILFSAAKDSNMELRAAAATKLRFIHDKEQTIKIFRTFLNDKSPKVRAEVVNHARYFHTKNENIYRIVLEKLSDPSAIVREKVVAFLGSYAGKIENSSIAQRLTPMLKDPDAKVRIAVVKALKNFENMQDVLVEALRDKNVKVVKSALYEIKVWKDEHGIEVILDLLKHSKGEVIYTTLYRLDDYGLLNKIPINALISILDNANNEAWTASVAIGVLRDIGPRAKDAVSPMLKIRGYKPANSSATLSHGVMQAIEHIGILDSEATTILKKICIDKEENYLRAALILHKAGEEEFAKSIFIQAIGDDEMFCDVIEQLKKIKAKFAVPIVKKRLLSGELVYDYQAIYACQFLLGQGVEGNILIPELLKRIKKKKESFQVCEMLRKISPDPKEMIPKLLLLLEDKYLPIMPRIYTLETILALDPMEAIAPLEEHLDHENISVRRRAREMLDSIYKE